MTSRKRVLVLGGGFGGMYTARRLERRLPPAAAEIVLINPENYMLYTPLLPEAAAGTVEPRHVGLDWAVAAAFPRDVAELGTLGHPEPLSSPERRD